MSEVGVDDVDHLVEGAFIRERLPAVAVIEREAVVVSSEWCESEALIWTEFVDSAQNEVAAADFDREAARGFALIQQRLDGRHDGRQPGRIWTAPSWGHGRSVPQPLRRPEEANVGVLSQPRPTGTTRSSGTVGGQEVLLVCLDPPPRSS